MRKRRCENCQYFNPTSIDRFKFVKDGAHPVSGECRKNSPGISIAAIDDCLVTSWVSVDAEDWCGEHVYFDDSADLFFEDLDDAPNCCCDCCK